MSGHSKWSQIKRQKGTADVKRGLIFSKLAKMISLAAKDGANPTTNFKLRLAIDQAKTHNLPNENIERAIKSGAGKAEGAKIEEAIYEVYVSAGAALIVIATTDNKNRATAEVKSVLHKYGAKLAPQGGVLYLFEQKGEIIIDYQNEQKLNREEIELLAIDNGATDIEEQDQEIFIYCDQKDLFDIKQKLENQGLKIISAKIVYLPKNETQASEETKEMVTKIIEALENLDDVSEVFVNI